MFATSTLASLLFGGALLATLPAAQADFVAIPAGEYRSTVRYEGDDGNRRVAAFALSARAVTVSEFEAFVRAHPQWRRGDAPALLVDSGYLANWSDADDAGDSIDKEAPVTHVSWFAADAYCKSIDARLPDWAEWEYVAAADASRLDARDDPAWRAHTFDDGTRRAMDARSGAAPNAYGVSGMHGAVWEWVGDYATLLGDADKRASDDGDRLQFCGATGLSFANRDDYAVLKRVALLSAMEPRSTLGNLGFRCARTSP
ncbi:formylglycine-generating enzyme family protein [Lysobacter arvi]|uniref:Formylglycine-generating enzyme family protein n=1 Tax=Lysobacter arvi TaxID=3038776 RepID=A0ABU1CDY3_9GAMM|nr:formylglycine-generating enzyme family protein [Lysobacter arvi]MDR0183396.1 formylglycine-generating enzyme family protein [Lysobacter arvi]